MVAKPVIVTDIDGNFVHRFDSVKDTARHYNVRHANVLYWIRTDYIKNGLVFTFENPKDKAHHTPYNMYHKVKHTEDVELDREFTILKYDVKFGRVSITDCPFSQYPKPKVGSGASQGCSHFRGRDRRTHEVACSKTF